MPKGNQGESRSKSTQNRLKMYDQKAKRDKKGKVLYQALQSKDKSHEARIAPDQRYYISTRTANQDELTRFREEVGKKLSSPATYVLKPGKVPFSLLKDVKQVRARIPLTFRPSQVFRPSFFFSTALPLWSSSYFTQFGDILRLLKPQNCEIGANHLSPHFLSLFTGQEAHHLGCPRFW